MLDYLHFELFGWDDTPVAIRFWIASAVFALFSLSPLTLR
jgi:UDP-N-acetylmuramyl pentapeptide phosphotransferase/UDP-N-acetylglucosamine-1-phosphate transferase